MFAGGFTLEAAEAVGEGEGIEGAEVLDLLSTLVDKSLVVVEEGDEEARYLCLRRSGSTGGRSSKRPGKRSGSVGGTQTITWRWPKRRSGV